MLSKNQYLNTIGIQQWKLRTASLELLTTAYCPSAQWLFILEKQEVELESPLLGGILAAIGQTKDTVTLAYYDNNATAGKLPALTQLRYIVAMGEVPVQQLQNHNSLCTKEIALITSNNLATLAQDITAKRQLWQQLKLHRI